MKRYIISALLCSVCFLLGQNNASAQFHIAVGYDWSQYANGVRGESVGNPFDGFSAEFGHTEFFIKKYVGLDFGVGYTFSTRSNEKSSVLGINYSSSTQEQYLQVPLRLVIDIPIKNIGIVLYGGGYGAFGLSGIDTYEFNTDEMGGSVSYDYLNDKIDSTELIPEEIVDFLNHQLSGSKYTKYDFGAQAGIGLRVKKSVMFHVSASQGLCNRYSNDDNGNLKRRSINAKVSFLF